MKKIFIVLLSVLAIVGLAGCETTTRPSKSSFEPVPNKVNFIDHRQSSGESLPLGTIEATDVSTPTRVGFKFGGWFTTKRGATWTEPTPVEFPFTASKTTNLYAYWEPLNSALAKWNADETYVSSMSKPPRVVMNPLIYEWSHEDDFIKMLSADLYSTEVDWDLAIAEGIADFPGDFSKFEAQEYSIEALDYHYILVAGAEYPLNQAGETAVVDGKYDRDLAQTMRDTVWRFQIREDLVFQDGTKIDAYTFEYTLKNWIDPEQNNYRANMWYKNAENDNGTPLVGGYEYLNQVQAVLDAEGNQEVDAEGKEVWEPAVVGWEEVGFKVIDKYTFEFHLTESMSLASAVGLGNRIRLVQPQAYARSLDGDGVNSKYGTPNHPYLSYGPYVLASWDANQKIVFNKNYDYVLKHTINYKSHEIQIVDDVDQAMDLFKAGKLSVVGLTKDYYAEFAEDPGVKSSWVNYPQYMIVNLSDSTKSGGHVQQTIVKDERLRQALLYGFDRNYFATNVYAPNTPALLPIPVNAKHYLFDPLYYTQTPQHLALLDELEIDIEAEGYMPTRAVDLFEDAYADWLAVPGNTGPVTLRLVADNDDFSDSLLDFIKGSYETLFTKDGVKRLIVDVHRFDSQGLKAEQESFNFDLTLTALGFGSSTDAFWQYPAIALVPALIGAAGFGLNHPFVGAGDVGQYIYTPIEVDLSYSLEHLENLDPADYEATYALLHDLIDEEGIFRGTAYQMWQALNAAATIYDGGPKEPFPGASHDLSNITAAFERIFFDYVPVVPTVTRSSATIYADNVIIDWPLYSEAFGWGAARYRYMNTDIDFS